MTAVKNFASVKLPESLVQQARDAAQPLRRSAAGQIEYWATLGRVVEHSGLTVQEARIAIENYEAAAQEAHHAAVIAPDNHVQAEEVIARFMAAEADPDPKLDSLESVKQRILSASTNGSLQAHVRRIVADNLQKAELRKAA